MSGYEINFDGLVGPTHHYAGLSFGNEASTKTKIIFPTRSWLPSKVC